MQVSNNLIFDSSAATGNVGAWINIGLLCQEISFHVIGLEAGGSLAINLSNASSQPLTGDPTAANAVISLPATSGPFIAQETFVAQWIQLVKTPGTTPTETTVRLLGKIY